MSNSIEEAHQELAQTVAAFGDQLHLVVNTGRKIVECIHAGNKILSAGNGGSAADALHLAEEFIGRYKGNRPSLPAICLAADVTALTCIGNDFGFDSIFSRQIEGLGKSGDVFVGFTTSGNSANIIKAFEAAKKRDVTTILLAGGDGGKAKGMADFEILVPSTTSARIQEIHTFILHHWLEMVEGESWAVDIH